LTVLRNHTSKNVERSCLQGEAGPGVGRVVAGPLEAARRAGLETPVREVLTTTPAPGDGPKRLNRSTLRVF
jgi:hypothetical protein